AGGETSAALSDVHRALSLIENGRLDEAGALLDAASGDPGTVRRAAIASGKGDLARARGDLETASRHYREAVVGYRESSAPSALAAGPLRNLGTVAAMQGDLDAAEGFYRQSLTVAERGGDRTSVARVLNNLGIVSVRRGDIAAAENFYQRALALNEELGAWRSHYINLFNLADVADARGDLASAVTLLRRSLAGFETLGEDSLRVAHTRTALADLLIRTGAFAEALRLFDAALGSYRRLAPDSPDVTLALMGLGNAARELGDLAAAEGHYLTALERRQAVAASSVEAAQVHSSLGTLYLELADTDTAERHFEQAQRIYADAAPASAELAAAVHGLARVQSARGHIDAALGLFERSIAALEAQTRQLGGADDARSLFGDQYARFYKDYLRELLAADLTARAFAVLERYRARNLVTLMAERELALDRSVPPALEAERARWQKAYDEAQARLIERLSIGAQEAEVGAIRSAMTEIRTRRDGVMQRIRAAAGDQATLRYTQPADLNGAARSLEAGTLALSYSVHDDHTVLFALSRDALRTFRIEAGDEVLREHVRRFRFLIASGDRSAAPSAALTAAGEALYDLLVRPAAVFADAERYLIVPDGPLHTLPFSALPVPSSSTARYLIEQVPLHKAQSMTLYASLRRSDAETPAEPRVVLFGNDYRSNMALASAADGTRSVGRLGELRPLPFVRQEINGINAVFAQSSTVFSGAEATERNVMEHAPRATYLHFAAHSVVDERVPLDSALVLEPHDDSENGLLQAWEIVEGLRTEASLVVLSACDTALGMETAGDGLVGLTRAFHVAGAQSVLASQWRVSDRSTARLMTGFYRRLHAGAPKDAALRAAQLELLHGAQKASAVGGWLDRWFPAPAEFSHPYYWAAFELSGWYR
ncbi:MAG: CHAT domain-containing tetratricopeptide repeat protein, partial [Pseudomonadota bacterium]